MPRPFGREEGFQGFRTLDPIEYEKPAAMMGKIIASGFNAVPGLVRHACKEIEGRQKLRVSELKYGGFFRVHPPNDLIIIGMPVRVLARQLTLADSSYGRTVFVKDGDTMLTQTSLNLQELRLAPHEVGVLRFPDVPDGRQGVTRRMSTSTSGRGCRKGRVRKAVGIVLLICRHYYTAGSMLRTRDRPRPLSIHYGV